MQLSALERPCLSNIRKGAKGVGDLGFHAQYGRKKENRREAEEREGRGGVKNEKKPTLKPRKMMPPQPCHLNFRVNPDDRNKFTSRNPLARKAEVLHLSILFY